MLDLAIKVRGLGKRFNLPAAGSTTRARTTLREDILQVPRRLLNAMGHRAQGNDFWALKDVSFDVRQGEVLGVIGKNGAGKSTLLKILSRIIEPTEGSIDVFGRVGSLLEVGTGFHPELTGRENIYLSGAILGMRRREVNSRLDEIVAFAEIERFLDTPAKHYSSGMYARLGFAVAAHLLADILIIDEVLAVGDMSFQQKCMERMSSVAREGRTVIFVSHSMSAIRQFCKTALSLERGRSKYWGTRVDEAIGFYASSAVVSAVVWEGSSIGSSENPWFSLRRMALIHECGRILAGAIKGGDKVRLEIIGDVMETHASLCVGFALYSADEAALLWSYHTDVDRQDSISISIGRNRLQVDLPTEWLNEGRYRIDFLCGLHGLEWISAPRTNCPSVSFEVCACAGDSPFRLTKRPVPLAPILQWSSD